MGTSRSSAVLALCALASVSCSSQRIEQSRLGEGARFGRSIAMSGALALVSAPEEASGKGAVYALYRAGEAWSIDARLTPSTPIDEHFGDAVALSGSTAVIGAPRDHQPGAVRAGSVYVFERGTSGWTESAALASGGTHQAWEAFGGAVAIDGDTLVVGAVDRDQGAAVDAGAAYVFVRGASGWSLAQTLAAPSPVSSDKFGSAVAIRGDTMEIAALRREAPRRVDAGRVFVYQRTGSTWSLAQTLGASDAEAGDLFGSSVALGESPSGVLRLVVGASQAGSVGASAAGAAYVFERPGASFAQVAILAPSDPGANAHFGIDVALSGDHAIVGASGAPGAALFAGAAYVFLASGGVWSQVARLDRSPSDASAFLGGAVGIANGHALVGATGEELGTVQNDSGAVHAFRELPGGAWAHSHVLHAAASSSGAFFGSSVALGGGAGGEVLVATSGARADVLRADADGWSIAQSLAAPSGASWIDASTDGDSVALFGRRTVAPLGLVDVHTRVNGAWTLQQRIEPDLVSPNQPAESAQSAVVAILGDTLAIGAPRWNGGDGRVFVWARAGTTWSQTQLLTSPQELTNFDMNFGRQVLLDGDTLVVSEVPSSGLPNTLRNGQVFVYQRAGATFELAQVVDGDPPAALDHFGESIAIDGDLLATLEQSTGEVRVHRRTEGVFETVWSTTLGVSVPSGPRALLALEGDVLAVGVPSASSSSVSGAGEIRLYRRQEGDSYVLEETLRAIDEVTNLGLGRAIALQDARLVAGTSDSAGRVYSFDL